MPAGMVFGGYRLRVFLFTDLVDSTAIKQRLGDEAGADAIAAHDALFRSLLARFEGVEDDRGSPTAAGGGRLDRP